MFLRCDLRACYFYVVSPLASILDLWNDEAVASQLFWGIGIFGLVLIVLQAIFGVLVGHDGDTSSGGNIDMSGGHGGGGSIVSLKTVSAMLLGFGFGGAILEKNGFSPGFSALGGLGTGLVIGAAYFALMNSLYRLRSDGTSVLSEAVNRSGTVYMRIPGNTSGSGEIQVSFGGRMQNIRAYTRGLELPTGTAVRIIALHGDQALLVEKLS
jgi:hypothetical protein